MTGPAYDIALVLHVAAAGVGFGAIGVSGLRARSGRRSAHPAEDPALRRFFAPGTDWPARMIFLVPLLGLGLLFGGDRHDASAAWPWIGLALWTGATGLATGACWPAESRAKEALADLSGGADGELRGAGGLRGDGGAMGDGGTRGDGGAMGGGGPRGEREATFRTACLQVERSVGWISLCFLAAVAVMVVQPG